MAGNHIYDPSERGTVREVQFWLGLSDRAVDALGSTAAGALMRQSYEQDEPQIVLAAIQSHLQQSAEAEAQTLEAQLV